MSRPRELQKGKSGQADRSAPTISPSQMGQRVLIIGNSFRGLGRFFLGFGGLTGGFLGGRVGFTVCGRFVGLGTFLVGLGRRLIRFTPIIRLVKTRALENDGRSGAENSTQLRLTAFR